MVKECSLDSSWCTPWPMANQSLSATPVPTVASWLLYRLLYRFNDMGWQTHILHHFPYNSCAEHHRMLRNSWWNRRTVAVWIPRSSLLSGHFLVAHILLYNLWTIVMCSSLLSLSSFTVLLSGNFSILSYLTATSTSLLRMSGPGK